MDFGGMLKKAQEMQKKMSDMKESLKNFQVEGIAGAGSVKVILNGSNEMIKIHIDPKLLSEDKEILEDLIVVATNNAKEKVELKAKEEMSKITGGLPLPPGFKLPF
jgi:hypothetical protein